MTGELHLTERGDAYTLKREVHVTGNGIPGAPLTCSAVMCVPAGAVVHLLCVLVYPDGFRQAVVECEGAILHVPEADLAKAVNP